MKQKVLTLLFLSLLLAGCGITPSRESETVITVEQLPPVARNFLQHHFEGVKVKEVVCERRASLMQYEVDLKGGIYVQFDRNGICTEVECKKSAVPDKVMPDEIVRQIREQFPGQFVLKYEHDSRMYEIELNDKTELVFNRAMRLVAVDRP